MAIFQDESGKQHSLDLSLPRKHFLSRLGGLMGIEQAELARLLGDEKPAEQAEQKSEAWKPALPMSEASDSKEPRKIMHPCGHASWHIPKYRNEQEKQAFEEFLNRAELKICNECRNSQQFKKAQQLSEGKDWPDLQGSASILQWAYSIRPIIIARCEARIKDLIREDPAQAIRLEKIRLNLISQEQARFWIDYRAGYKALEMASQGFY